MTSSDMLSTTSTFQVFSTVTHHRTFRRVTVTNTTNTMSTPSLSSREPLQVVASTSDDDGFIGFQYVWPVRVHKRPIDNGDSMVLNVSPPFTTAINGVAFTWALRLCDECVVAAPGENGASSLRQVFLMLYYKDGPASDICVDHVKMSIHDHDSGNALLSIPLNIENENLTRGNGYPVSLSNEDHNAFTTFIHSHIGELIEIQCDFKLKSSMFWPLAYLPLVESACRSQRIEKACEQFMEDLSSGKIVIPQNEEEPVTKEEKFAHHRRIFIAGCDYAEQECLREGKAGDEDELVKHVRGTMAHVYFKYVLLNGVHYFEDFVQMVDGVLGAQLPPLRKECERFICKEVMAVSGDSRMDSVNTDSPIDMTFIKKMLVISEKFSMDHLKMVSSSVIVDTINKDAEKPIEDLDDMRDELKQIASEISTSCENLDKDASEDDLVDSVVDELQTLAQRMRRVSLSHSPSLGSVSSSPASSSSVTPTTSATHSPAALDSPRPFESSSPPSSASRFKRVELDKIDDTWYVYPPEPVATSTPLLRTH